MSKLQTAAEIIVVARPEAELRVARGAAPAGAAAAGVSSLGRLLKSSKCALEPLFGATEERVASWVSPGVRAAAPEHPDPATFYALRGDLSNHEKLIEGLLNEPSVLGAYYKPPGEPPEMERPKPRDAMPDAPLDMAPAPTPSFEARQGYLDAAPGGIDARFAGPRPRPRRRRAHHRPGVGLELQPRRSAGRQRRLAAPAPPTPTTARRCWA